MNVFTNIEYSLEFLKNIFLRIVQYIYNSPLAMCFVLPVIVGTVLVLIDFIFDFVNIFSDDKARIENYLPYEKYKIRYNRMQKDKKQSREDFYEKNKSLAELKHNNKMQELNKFKENADYRHDLKVKENELYKNSKKNYDFEKKSTVKSTYKSKIDKSKLDIYVDDD